MADLEKRKRGRGEGGRRQIHKISLFLQQNFVAHTQKSKKTDIELFLMELRELGSVAPHPSLTNTVSSAVDAFDRWENTYP